MKKATMTTCPLCEKDKSELVCSSSLIIQCGYGSKHDMEIFESDVICGECIDRIIELIQSEEFRLKLKPCDVRDW